VEYRSNENSTAANDLLVLKVMVGDKIYLEERFTITVYPESYWDGLQIGSNNTLLGKQVEIYIEYRKVPIFRTPF
jgi:hypothetical protein